MMWILASVPIVVVTAYIARKKLMSNSYEDAMRLRDESVRAYCFEDDYVSNSEIIKFLIDKGADMNTNCDTLLRKRANGENDD